MSWQSVVGSIFYYVLLCLQAIILNTWTILNYIFDVLLVVLAPVTHLVTYIAHGFLLPVRFLGKFEVGCPTFPCSTNILDCNALSTYYEFDPASK